MGTEYLKKHKASGIKVGDIVKVVRRAESFENGWNDVWEQSMDEAIGQISTVTADDDDGGFELNYDCFYPYFVLEVQYDDKYQSLQDVLEDAEGQASKTKGVERHANNNNFEDQVMCQLGRLLKNHPFGSLGFQVCKKTIEAGRLYGIKGQEAAYQEVLGAINYLAGMGILIKEKKEGKNG